jgi:hypothetical protein
MHWNHAVADGNGSNIRPRIGRPRMTAWFGDAAYRYSGILHQPTPLPAIVQCMRERAERLSGASCRWYRSRKSHRGPQPAIPGRPDPTGMRFEPPDKISDILSASDGPWAVDVRSRGKSSGSGCPVLGPGISGPPVAELEARTAAARGRRGEQRCEYQPLRVQVPHPDRASACRNSAISVGFNSAGSSVIAWRRPRSASPCRRQSAFCVPQHRGQRIVPRFSFRPLPVRRGIEPRDIGFGWNLDAKGREMKVAPTTSGLRRHLRTRRSRKRTVVPAATPESSRPNVPNVLIQKYEMTRSFLPFKTRLECSSR